MALPFWISSFGFRFGCGIAGCGFLWADTHAVEQRGQSRGVGVAETRRAGLTGEIRGQQGEGRAGPQVRAALQETVHPGDALPTHGHIGGVVVCNSCFSPVHALWFQFGDGSFSQSWFMRTLPLTVSGGGRNGRDNSSTADR